MLKSLNCMVQFFDKFGPGKFEKQNLMNLIILTYKQLLDEECEW